MANFLGRQLWSIYEDLKREKKIGFLTDDEFQKYFLGFISYKYLSEKVEAYVNKKIKWDYIDFEDAYNEDIYKNNLMENSIRDLGYFLKPDLLFRNVVSSKNYGNIIIEELEKAFNEISESSRGRASEEDFLNLFEGVDLNASQLGKTLEDKNRVVFNILDALSSVHFDLSKPNLNNTLLHQSAIENSKYAKTPHHSYDLKRSRLANKSNLPPHHFRKSNMDAEFNQLRELNSIEAEYLRAKKSLSVEADALMFEKSLSIEPKVDADIDRDFYDDYGNDFEDEDPDYEEYIDDIIGNGFEYLLSEFSLNSSNSLDYYTPKDVSRLIARLIASQKDHIFSVYDPCCGSASLLIEVYKELTCNFICGQEINASFYNIARENMILHNIHYNDFDIKQGDTLEQPQHLNYTFDAVVSEIPFNSKWTADKAYLDDVRFMDYKMIAPRTKADYAFIQHMLYHLDDDGIMIVVVPHGVLFRSAAEGAIRKQIIKNNYLDAVIGLPANMFYSTNIPTCLMIFKKNRIYDDVLFIDASRKFNYFKLINNFREEDIDIIVDIYKNRVEVDKHSLTAEKDEIYSYRASIEDIEKNDFNLNIPRYVDTYPEPKKINADELIKEHQSKIEEIKEVTSEIKKVCRELDIEDNLFE